MSNTQHASVFPEQGLSSEEVLQSKATHGLNALALKQDRVLFNVLKEIVLEPMFILLLAACIIYFIAGDVEEGVIMLVSIFIVAGISIFQEYRSRNAVKALNKLSQSMVTVIRNGKEVSISMEEVVVNDLMRIEEGEIIAADAVIIEARDLSINESILTGESLAVYKNTGENMFRGTLVTSGNAFAKVSAVGLKTMFGKIGQSVTEVPVIKTPLQIQIKNFVTKMVWFGAGAFILVVGINYWQSHKFMQSFMQGLTLAMSVLPEEIPVAFSTFQALGAFRLLKNQIIVKQPQYVETLGAATVICADKTGTLTQNQMHLVAIFSLQGNESSDTSAGILSEAQKEVLTYAMWSSETSPFDPMEISIHKLYGETTSKDLRQAFTQIHEYPIGGSPPMMTHVFQNQKGEYVIAAKGAVERLVKQSSLSQTDQQTIEQQSLNYARQGYRVLGVGRGRWENTNWPATQEEIPFDFLGLLAFQDPPKDKIVETIKTFHDAGIEVKMITGDYKETALAIAKQIGMNPDPQYALEGKEIVAMSDEALRQKVGKVNIYARMFPEAKLRIINALKDNGEIVAMTGDGVNDAPALKAAHIGISMGKRGSEVAKGAASLILTDDDLSHMTDAVALGRKIYDNLKKAIQYIVSIHIPIILVVTLPLLLGWAFKDIFSPVHVIFLELIMGPTCSIIYENEPMEPGTMQRPPRKMGNTFLSLRQLGISIIQGLAITAACLGIGYWSIQQGHEETLTRTMIFITLLFSNVFLTLVNRSFTHTIFTTLRYKNNLLPLIIGITLAFIAALLYWQPLQELFRLSTLSIRLLLACIATAFIGTFWLELVKGIRHKI
ncbi:MAG: cation-translocating P-type ATPase [Chitinophagaceae bacterium]